MLDRKGNFIEKIFKSVEPKKSINPKEKDPV